MEEAIDNIRDAIRGCIEALDTSEERANWRIAGAGYGIHRPDLDEDLGASGQLQGAPAPRGKAKAA
jgi:hypothetical protein